MIIFTLFKFIYFEDLCLELRMLPGPGEAEFKAQVILTNHPFIYCPVPLTVRGTRYGAPVNLMLCVYCLLNMTSMSWFSSLEHDSNVTPVLDHETQVSESVGFQRRAARPRARAGRAGVV